MTKRILVTGGAGFIAHHFIDYLMKNTDWEIVTLDRLDYSGNLNRLHEVVQQYPEKERRRVYIVHHDLKAALNPQIVNTVGSVNYVVHMAAGSHVDRSIEFPMEFVYDNVIGTCNILEYVRGLDTLEKFIYFSTDEVFGPAPNGVNFDEYARYNSTNPYSASKAGGEELVVAYQNTYKIPAIITHTMNVFGERQHPEKFIPMCIKRIRDKEVVQIHSDQSKTKAGSRHYIHAYDVADAIYFILTNDLKTTKTDEFGVSIIQKLNIVGAKELDNLEVAQLIAKSMNKGLMFDMVDFHSSRPGHDLRYSLSGERMRELGWTPKPIEERMKQMVSWTLENQRWLDI